MAQLTDIAAVVVAALNLVAGALGGVAWWRGEAGAAVLARRPRRPAGDDAPGRAGRRPARVGLRRRQHDLLYLYLLLPIAVSIIAEQLRLASAQTVLDQRELENAQAVGALPEDEQMAIVRAIMRREAGVMTVAALVIAFLALRVLGTA